MDNLGKLLFWRGIASNYFNYRGEDVTVSVENRASLLTAMGIDIEDGKLLESLVFEAEIEPWLKWLQPMIVVTLQDHVQVEVNLHPGVVENELSWRIVTEDGQELEGSVTPVFCDETGNYIAGDVRYSRRGITLPPVSIGYHSLEFSGVDENGEQKTFKSTLVVVPRQSYQTSALASGKRLWGVVIQLYTLQSHRNWGIGDFTDLKYLIGRLAEDGADIVGLNPLHALRTPVEFNCSPYSPSDRRFIDPLYIDPAEVEEYDAQFLEVDVAPLRLSEYVQYAQVYAIKMSVFRKMYARFCENELNHDSGRARQFSRFVKTEGKPLSDYCLHQTLADAGNSIDYKDHDYVQALKKEYVQEIEFYSYLQWLASIQFEGCQKYARDVGMDIGLMRDLAVGADSWGAEIQTNEDLFCAGAAIGAPPDPLAEKGQNWGLPPMDPFKLKSTQFSHYISLLQHNLRHCGALRIDHAMALMRLWWCPPGKTADYGAYIYYPFEEMMGLLKLESERNKTVIIGEDMGVVPHEFRQALFDSRIFTNKLFYFEKEHDGSFKHPDAYEPGSLAMLTNHDVPTLSSWWCGSDLLLRDKLDLFESGAVLEDVLRLRETEKNRLLDWLQMLGVYDVQDRTSLLASPLNLDLASAILEGGAMCASQLFVIQLEDLELMEAPVNVPGTSTEYRNWQRKLVEPIEDLFAHENINEILKKISVRRQSS